MIVIVARLKVEDGTGKALTNKKRENKRNSPKRTYVDVSADCHQMYNT